MKAIVIDKPGDVEVLQENEVPTPKPGRHDVLVKVRGVGFNPVDYKMRLGHFPQEYPKILGGDFSGIVEAKGDLVRGFELGDEVYGMSFGPCSNGAYAEYIAIDEEMVAKKPSNLSFEKAAAVPIAYLTAFQTLIAKGAFQEGRALFIAGSSGGVGTAALSLAKTYKSGPIFTLAGSEKSADFLKEHFAIADERIVRYQGLSVEETARLLIEKNGSKRFYFALDYVGKKAKELCFEVADFHGHIASILSEDEDFPVKVWAKFGSPMWQKNLSLHTILLLSPAMTENREDYKVFTTQLAHLAKLFESGELQKPIVENLGGFSAKTVQNAHDRLEEGHTKGKLTMSLSHST